MNIPRQLESQLVQVAEVLPERRWMLVGGIMVHVHAWLSGVVHPRTTNDVDAVVMGDYALMAAALQAGGYSLWESLDATTPLHRFVQGEQIVDLMTCDDRTVHFFGREVVKVPASKSALRRTIQVQIGEHVILVPDLASALSLKGAALQTDGLNQVKHQEDGITLFACIGGRQLDLSKSMRRNTNRMIAALSFRSAWEGADETTAARAIAGIRSVRPSWKPPA